jgi:murein DD-endopeptidase MepM/ murein hydrolase activator NlpD
MSSYQPFLRRRVINRVASVCGMFVVLPMLGCSSPDTAYDYDRPSRGLAAVSSPGKSRPSRDALASAGSAKAYAAAGAVKAKPDVVQSYSHVTASAPVATASIERTSLPPLAGATEPASKDEGASAGYALGSVDYEGGAKPLVREANGYGKQRPYPRAESDYAVPPQEPRGGYVREERYREEPRGGGGGAQGGEYVVQRGDTLYAIAEQNGISLDELTALNDLKSEEIYPGQRLRVEGRPAAYGAAKPYREREARPEPRGYREAAPQRPAPERERYDEARGDYRQAPQSNVYERGENRPREQRFEKPERYEETERYDQRRPAERAYREDRAPREREAERVYEEPRGDAGRPEYTASNRKYTPDGPFAPSPEAPWRGEAEWRRTKPQADRMEGYEPQPEPRYETRPAPAEAYQQRAPYQQARPVERTPVERGPYAGPPPGREPYPIRERGAAPPPRGGNGGGAYFYTVQRGETLYEIARRNGLDQRELAAFNGLPPDARLLAGQALQIPGGRGYEWSRPRPEASNQAAPPARPQRALVQTAERTGGRETKSLLQAERAGGKEVRSAAAPETAKPAPQRQAKAAEPTQVQHRPAARPAPAEVVEEETPPARSGGNREPQPERVAAAAPSEPPAEVAANEPDAPKPGAHAMTERPAPPRDCEALLASPEARTAKTFRTPVQGMMIAKFGAQPDGSFNDGVNFSVPKGTPVKAAENGVVAYAGDELPGFGNLVLIRHADGYVTAYAHNDELLVQKCDVVTRGQIISKAGASGKASSPQLHFELRKDSKPIDPDSQFSGT